MAERKGRFRFRNEEAGDKREERRKRSFRSYKARTTATAAAAAANFSSIYKVHNNNTLLCFGDSYAHKNGSC